jgi:hypothetical protein
MSRNPKVQGVVPNAIDEIEFVPIPVPIKSTHRSSWAQRAQEMIRLMHENGRTNEWALFRSGIRADYAYMITTNFRRMFPDAEWITRSEPDGFRSIYVAVTPTNPEEST